MTQQRDITDNGSWLYAQELYERGDPLFVAEVRRLTDADRLGNFAPRWHADHRPEARQLLRVYLDQPLNAFRHEPLVKRLFKLAEAAADDEVLGWFLVAFDRSVRRKLKKMRASASAVVATREEAEALAGQWRAQGYQAGFWSHWARDAGGRFVEQGFFVHRSWLTDLPRVPDGTTMARPEKKKQHGPYPITEEYRRQLERCRLFSVATRRYLRRRAWRYFRKLGKEHPERYVAALAAALKGYRDEDVADGLALIDCWGLTHALFHHSPVLVSRRNGWGLAPGRGLSELTPAPSYEPLWRAAPRVLLELLREARSRPVRQWAVQMIRRDHAGVIRGLSSEELFGLLTHQDPAVVSLAAEVLRDFPDLSVLGVDRLLRLVEEPNPETLDVIAELLGARLGPERVTLEQAAHLAASRPLPAARLGFLWLRTKAPASEADCRALLALAEAQAEPVRAEMVRWARGLLSVSPHFQPGWVMEYLDSRHSDVRAEGWQWLEADERVRDNVEVWRKLLESPYDDVRLKLVAALEKRASGGVDALRVEAGQLDDDLLRFVWASVLLNVQRGGRTKPVAVGQLVRRLGRRPDEARALLPILAVALRSMRGPEWRAGLAGVVALAERNADLRPLVMEMFPELKLS
ncbi:MAG TPA: hypothetical protein VKA46_00765 [Gemmataceae bacterium]|nr:hypothetical protein [Gemmataceae bacterium]